MHRDARIILFDDTSHFIVKLALDHFSLAVRDNVSYATGRVNVPRHSDYLLAKHDLLREEVAILAYVAHEAALLASCRVELSCEDVAVFILLVGVLRPVLVEVRLQQLIGLGNLFELLEGERTEPLECLCYAVI